MRVWVSLKFLMELLLNLKYPLSILRRPVSPFGGINFDVKVIGGIATHKVPEDLKKAVTDKPVMPLEIPHDGWEILEIKEQKPAHNMKYRSPLSEPVYWASWVYKISWKPQESGGI
jgi:hypothetical protein